MYNPSDEELLCIYFIKTSSALSSMAAAMEEEAIKFHHSWHRAIREGITLLAQIVAPKESNKICQVLLACVSSAYSTHLVFL